MSWGAAAAGRRWKDGGVTPPAQQETQALGALTRAREVAEDHMVRAERAGLSWREETISELLWVHAVPFVRCADFTRHEEKVVGADWLWWWVDELGECFGMLVQAKRMKLATGGDPELDFMHNKGEQMKRLLRSADQLGVPSVYALYFGGADFRGRLTCGTDEHTEAGCRRCSRASVSVLTSLQARRAAGGSKRDAAVQSFRGSVPLEDLVDPLAAARPVHDLNLKQAVPEMRDFLTQPQSGARGVAKEVLRAISDERLMQFSALVAERVRLHDDLIFPELPTDSGHFAEPYFPFVLRGLRSRPPSYVSDILADQPVPSEVSDLVGGVVVVRC